MSPTPSPAAADPHQLRGREGVGQFRRLIAESLTFPTAPGRPIRAGVEIEFHTRPVGAPGDRVEYSRLAAILDHLPDSVSTSVEPGGQVELNGPPDHDLGRLVARTRSEVATLREVLCDHGVEVTGGGLDPGRPPRRLLNSSRYRNMEVVFDRLGPAGRLMMNNTASFQITVDPAGDPGEAWSMAHRLGPCLLAASGSSPRAHPDLPGDEPWHCERHRVWESVDPSRVGDVSRCGRPMAEAWSRFALEAQVIEVPATEGGEPVAAPPGLTLRRWITQGFGGTGPTVAEALGHVTTLFPWIRPRGTLELRMMDAPLSLDPGPLLALAGVLMTRSRLWPEVREVTQNTQHCWSLAARCGPAHPLLATALDDLVTLATAELDRTGYPSLGETVRDWWDRGTYRGGGRNRNRAPLRAMGGGEVPGP